MCSPTTSEQIEQVVQLYRQLCFKYLQEWKLRSLSGHPVSESDPLHSKIDVSCFQVEFIAFLFTPIASSTPFTPFCHVFIYIGMLSTEPSFLQADQSQLSDYPHMHILCSLNHLCDSSLHSFRYVPVSLGNPELTKHSRCVSLVLCREEGSCPLTSGNALPNARNGPISLLWCKGTLMAHAQLGVHWDPQVSS